MRNPFSFGLICLLAVGSVFGVTEFEKEKEFLRQQIVCDPELRQRLSEHLFVKVSDQTSFYFLTFKRTTPRNYHDGLRSADVPDSVRQEWRKLKKPNNLVCRIDTSQELRYCEIYHMNKNDLSYNYVQTPEFSITYTVENNEIKIGDIRARHN